MKKTEAEQTPVTDAELDAALGQMHRQQSAATTQRGTGGQNSATHMTMGTRYK